MVPAHRWAMALRERAARSVHQSAWARARASIHENPCARARTCHAYRPADGALEGSEDTDLIDPARTKKRQFVLWVASGETICTVGPSNAVGLGNLYCGSQ